jgi:ABC-type histidine transport system ATPase subunit
MADSAVHVKDVVKRFGATESLAGVALDIEEATVFELLGPNGAGKTTLDGSRLRPKRALHASRRCRTRAPRLRATKAAAGQPLGARR